MDKIPSFTIDHTRLSRGIFVSRTDITPSGDIITTFDIRLTEPNRQPPMSGQTAHALEHLAATFLRNHSQWKDKVIYWGPMGCLTGSYLILQGNLKSVDIVPLMRQLFEFVRDYTGAIPGATPRDCGNYSFMDLAGAKAIATKFIEEVLDNLAPQNLNYPE